MPRHILMPSLAAGMEDGHLVRWLKKPGDKVAKGDVLVEIETDKALMEMEAEEEGILGAVMVPDNTPGVPVNQIIALLLAPGESLDDVEIPHPAPQAAASTPAPVKVEEAGKASAPRASAGEVVAASSTAKRRGAASSPLARRLARAYGLDVGSLEGSGPRGRVVRIDVERARQAPSPRQAGPAVDEPRRSRAASTPLHHAWLRQGTGRPLVFVHGFGSSLNGWRPFLSGASNARPVLGIDLPGHGGSRAHAAGSFEEYVEAVSSTLEQLDLGRVDLVGHSLGGAISTAVAAQGRVDVVSLFLIAPAGLGPEINGAFIDGFARARGEESLAPWLKLLVADAALVDRAMVRATLSEREDEVAVPALQACARALFPDGTQAFSVRRELERLDIPVTVVFGQEDRIVPVAHARGLPWQVGLHLFATTGHMPQLEAREGLWKLLERHVRSAG